MITSLNRSITIAAVLCLFGINAATAGNICHATGYTLDEEGDGLSWSSPMSLPQALATVQSSNWSEIWLKGDVTVSSAPSEVSINNNLIIRGGFTGQETDPSERPQGSMSVFSGNNTYNIMVVKVAAGMTLSFERVFFTKAANCALKKTGNGSLFITESSFSQNGRAIGHNKNVATGCGLYVSGSGILSVSSTAIEGNGPIGYPENTGGGWGVYVTGAQRAFFDDCSFVTNGTKLGKQSDEYSGKHKGVALWAKDSPVTLRRCRFAGNTPRCGQTKGTGATVFLEGSCGGTAFTNCTFVGNNELLGHSAVNGGGTLRINLNNSSATVDMKGCTFAYNLSQTIDASAGISIVQGTVNVTDSTFFYNLLGHSRANHRGNDIYVNSTGRLSISNSTLTSREHAIGYDSGAIVTIDQDTICTDDPKFISSPLDFESLLAYVGSSSDHSYSISFANDAAMFAKMSALDATPLDPRPAKPNIGAGNVLYVKADASGNRDGSSWIDAFIDLESALKAVSDVKTEVWIAGNLAPSAAPTSVYIENDVVVRGGFSGSESALNERAAIARTVIDGANACDLVAVSVKAEVNVLFERIDFTRAKARAFDKRGLGNISFMCCDFMGNGRETRSVDGRAIRAWGGQGEACLSVSNCIFGGQMYKSNATDTGSGAAIYAANLARLTVDDSLFVTNGVPKANSNTNGGGKNVHGWAVSASSTPVTMRRTRFSGNCGALSNATGTRDGGVVYIEGNSYSSAFTNCVFTGNYELRKSNDNNSGGALVFAPSSSSATLDVENCTFAYNISQGNQSPSALNVRNGNVNVHNSIFWKNLHGSVTTTAYGSEIEVSSGTVNMSHTIITSTDPAACHGSSPTSISMDNDSIYTIDPMFVTSYEEFETLFSFGSSYAEPSAKWTYSDAASLDVHLLSPVAYFLNDGSIGPATSEYSPAIDLGDPMSDFSKELGSNGNRINLGAYGNTARASQTPVGQPSIKSLEVAGNANGYARPRITLVTGLASGVNYNATVTLTCSTGGVVVATKVINDVQCDTTIIWEAPIYLPLGTEVEMFASISAKNASTVEEYDTATASGIYPAFHGKGGGDGVLHVRAGADCMKNGKNWTDAFPDLESAIAAIDENTREIWMTEDIPLSSATIITDKPLVIRGGFSGTENSFSERAENSVTKFDYAYAAQGFVVQNSAPVEFERIAILRTTTRAFLKTGTGDFTLSGCRISGCGIHNLLAGRALHANGGQSAVVTITNCIIEGNMTVDHKRGESSNHGAAVMVDSCKRLFVDDSLFVSNGMQLVNMSGAYNYFGYVKGSAIYAKATPVTAIRSRFAANCNGTRSDGGGTVFLDGNCSGSAFTNCAFVGNFERMDSDPRSNYGKNGGALCISLGSKTQTVDIEGCTFAYNLSSGYQSAAGINIIKGSVNVHNSILWNNQRSRSRTNGTSNDLQVHGDGVCSISHSIVTSLDAVALSGAALTLASDTLYALDPLFVSPTDFFLQVYTIGEESISGTSLFTYDTLSGFDVHLLSSAHYVRNDGSVGRSPGINSPAINLGDRASAYDAEPQPNGRRVNLGAYGNTKWASFLRDKGLILFVR